MATETKQYTCPAEDCEYTGTEDSVAAHYSGTRKKPDHSGGYERAKQRMGSGEETRTEPEAGSGESTETDTGESGGSSDSEVHPTFGNGDKTGENDGEVSDKDVELPCGCESFSTENCPEPPFWVTCDTCGKSFQVTEL